MRWAGAFELLAEVAAAGVALLMPGCPKRCATAGGKAVELGVVGVAMFPADRLRLSI